MTKHNCKIVAGHKEYVNNLAAKGIFSCNKISRTGTRCMCTFSTKSGLKSHKKNDVHRFPTSDLKSWVNELHTSGKFAYCLATGKY